MAYEVTTPPDDYQASWWRQELDRIKQAMDLQDLAMLARLHAEPVRPRSGMVVFADGTDWNPGTGEGIYAYYNGTWNKLG